MNSNNTYFTNSNKNVRVQYSNEIRNSPSRIETTHYVTNTISSTNQGYQTVAFEQQPISQTTSRFSGCVTAFRIISEDEAVILRPDIGRDIDALRTFSRFSFDPAVLCSKDFKFHTCTYHMEERINIVYENVNGRSVFKDNVCNLCLNQSNYEEKGYKIEHYTTVLKKRKEEILSLNEENFVIEYHVESLWQNLKSLILNSAVKAIDYSKSFQDNYIPFLTNNKMSQKDIDNIRILINYMREKNMELDFRGIEEKPELKQQYISLAIFLISFKKQNMLSLNFYDMESCLKKYILQIYQLRQETVNNYTEWIRQLVGYYHSLCQIGMIQIDNAFLSTININLYSEARVEYRESGEYMQKYNELLIKYNTEIKAMNLTIYNLRNTATSTNIKFKK